MLSKALFIGGGIAGTTAITGTIAYLITNKSQSINTLLNQNKLKLIDTNKDTEGKWKTKWNDKWVAFKAKYKENTLSDSWKFGNWANLENQVDAPDDFLNKCTENSKASVYSVKDTLYLEITTYCAEGI